MKIVAITGTIGSGKTTLANIIKDLGYVVYDVDSWVRRLYQKKNFIDIIDKNFSGIVVDGKVKKRDLRNIVFGDNNKLKKLESLIHPFLRKVLKNLIWKNTKYNDLFFIDIALLFEMKWDKYCDFIILADAQYDVCMKRVMQRDNISKKDFEKIIKTQISNKDKEEFSDVVVDTDKPINMLRVELIKLIESINNGC